MYDKHAYAHANTSSAGDLTSAAAIAPTFIVDRPCQVYQIGIKITTATSSSGNVVVTVYQRPVFASASNQVSLGTITIPTGIAAGVVYVNNLSDATAPILNVGDQVAFVVTTAATSAGQGIPVLQLVNSPYSDLDDSDIVTVTA